MFVGLAIVEDFEDRGSVPPGLPEADDVVLLMSEGFGSTTVVADGATVVAVDVSWATCVVGAEGCVLIHAI